MEMSDDYSSFTQQTLTDLAISNPNNWRFLLIRSGDTTQSLGSIMAIKINDTRSKNTEIFFLDVSDYTIPERPTKTGFPFLDENWQFVPSKYDRNEYKNLIAMKLNGKYFTECHICFEKENYAVVEAYPTVLPITNSSVTKFLYWEYLENEISGVLRKYLSIIGCTSDRRLLNKAPHEPNLSMLFSQPAKLNYIFKLVVDIREYPDNVWHKSD